MPLELESVKTNNIKPDGEPLRICFVCTGNTCRSPMAAAVLNHYGNGRYKSSSAGIVIVPDEPINEKSVEALKNAGILPSKDNDYPNHKATRLTRAMIEAYDRIICVSAWHAMTIIETFPEYASKVTSFDKSISDPFGQSQEIYDKCLSEIKKCISETFLIDIN